MRDLKTVRVDQFCKHLEYAFKYNPREEQILIPIQKDDVIALRKHLEETHDSPRNI